eukprot:g13818.t1 g13818   contig9:526981-529374(+)
MTSAALPSSAPAAASVGGQRNHDDLSADPFAGIKPTTNCKDASVARARRLERNRPIELRRREKTREEELLHQRSVGFYVTFISEIRHHLNQQQSILQTLRSSITEYEESTLQIDNETSIILNNNQKLKGQWRKIVEANIREYKEAKKLRAKEQASERDNTVSKESTTSSHLETKKQVLNALNSEFNKIGSELSTLPGIVDPFIQQNQNTDGVFERKKSVSVGIVEMLDVKTETVALTSPKATDLTLEKATMEAAHATELNEMKEFSAKFKAATKAKVDHLESAKNAKADVRVNQIEARRLASLVEERPTSSNLQPQSADMKTLMDAVTAVTSNNADAQAAAAAVAAFPFPPSSSSSTAAFVGSLPIRKRNHDEVDLSADPFSISIKPVKRGRKIGSTNCKDASVARAIRLEKNRLGAIELRRRKKIMEEELQRSVSFYTKSNASLKNQNAELERQILMARHTIIHGVDGGVDTVASTEAVNGDASSEKESSNKSDPTVSSSTATNTSKRSSAGYAEDVSSSTATNTSKRSSAGYAEDDYTPFKSPISSMDDEQVQQAQFATTQALHKSVDFPPIQYKSTKVDPSEAAAAIASISSAAKASVDEELNKQQLQTLPSSSLVAPVVVEPNSSPKVDPNVAYVEALTNFAMEQAAAANSAAAAATAAIQAVNFYRQRQQMEGRSSTFVGSTSKLHCLDFFRSNK